MQRRTFLLTSLLPALLPSTAEPSEIDPKQTFVLPATDRIQMVMSGTWWVNSGADFTPDMAVPVPAGGYVKRTARTFHYDGVRHGIKEPVVIAIFGIGPVDIRLADPHLPAWRQV